MTTVDEQQLWRAAHSTIVEWFRHNDMNEAEHRCDNCCETEDNVLEWMIQRDGIVVRLALLNYNANVVLQAYSTLG